MKIIHHNFSEAQYMDEVNTKSQIVMHHTVSGVGVEGDISWWEQTKERIATCVIIDREGTIHVLFDPKKWAHHLGVKNYLLKQHGLPYYKNSSEKLTWNEWLNKHALAIELDNWGGLAERNGKFYSTTGLEIPKYDVVDYEKSIRGYRYYEEYSCDQIEALKFLLELWGKQHSIDIKYNSDIWDVNDRALKGENGLFTHVSYRPDKSDCHPQQSLIDMLKEL